MKAHTHASIPVYGKCIMANAYKFKDNYNQIQHTWTLMHLSIRYINTCTHTCIYAPCSFYSLSTCFLKKLSFSFVSVVFVFVLNFCSFLFLFFTIFFSYFVCITLLFFFVFCKHISTITTLACCYCKQAR